MKTDPWRRFLGICAGLVGAYAGGAMGLAWATDQEVAAEFREGDLSDWRQIWSIWTGIALVMFVGTGLLIGRVNRVRLPGYLVLCFASVGGFGLWFVCHRNALLPIAPMTIPYSVIAAVGSAYALVNRGYRAEASLVKMSRLGFFRTPGLTLVAIFVTTWAAYVGLASGVVEAARVWDLVTGLTMGGGVAALTWAVALRREAVSPIGLSAECPALGVRTRLAVVVLFVVALLVQLAVFWYESIPDSRLVLAIHPSDCIRDVVFSPDGKRVASVDWDDGTVKVWDMDTGKEIWSFQPSRQPRVLVFRPDGKHLAAATPGEVLVWDASNGQTLRSLRGHTSDPWGLVYSLDGKYLASGSGKGGRPRRGEMLPDDIAWPGAGEVIVWDTTTGKALRNLPGQALGEEAMPHELRREGDRLGFGFTCLAISPDGKYLAVGKDRSVIVWNLAADAEFLHLRGHTQVVASVTFSPDGKLLASASGSEDPAILPDGRESRDPAYGEVKVWKLTTGKATLTLNQKAHDGAPVFFTSEGKFLVSNRKAGNVFAVKEVLFVKVWKVENGDEVTSLSFPEPKPSLRSRGQSFFKRVLVNRDGNRLAVAQSDGKVVVWDLVTGKELYTLKAHKGSVSSMAFRLDGARLVTAGGFLDGPGEMLFWDVSE